MSGYAHGLSDDASDSPSGSQESRPITMLDVLAANPATKLSAEAIADAEHRLHIEGFLGLCRVAAIPMPTREYRFHPDRKWRFDWAWPRAKLALEEDGGIYVGGKHGRGAGIARDHEKRNAAVVLGWRVLVVQPRQLVRPSTVSMVKEALRAG